MVDVGAIVQGASDPRYLKRIHDSEAKKRETEQAGFEKLMELKKTEPVTPVSEEGKKEQRHYPETEKEGSPHSEDKPVWEEEKKVETDRDDIPKPPLGKIIDITV